MRASERGVTLIELMVSIAVASVVILAATQAVMVVTQAKRTNERRLEVAEASGTALALISFDAQNAGFRFASPVFSVRVINNVQGNESELGTITDTANCGPANWGIAKGSDTLEFRYGLEDLVPGVDSPMTCGGGNCSVTLGGGGARNPFYDPGPDGLGAIVLLANATGACLGRVTANVSGSTMNMQLLGLDMTNTNEASYPGCANGTFTAMRAGRRVRYMICEPPAGQPTERPGLYRQVALDAAGFTAPELVQEGVEDLQVALRYDNPDALLTGAGCVGTTCVCNRAAGDCADLDLNVTGVDIDTAAPAEQQMPFRLRGLDVAVTAVSTRTQFARGSSAPQQYLRPALYDHPVGTVFSEDLRHTRQTTLSLINLVMVRP